ncbi:MAG: 50S ribosomal protein L17 [Deltaproteobacteria bacterium]|nr:50S ribosomal protein L17 [Candidatus Tharpella sp.]
MRHRVSGRRLGRSSSHQKAMFRSLAAALITHEHIETTDARAKELRRVTDRLVTLGKKGTLHARRQAYKFLNNHQLVQKLFDEIAPRFSERPGGYTRLIKSRIRFVDQAPMTFVRFVDSELTDAASEKKESTETAAPISVEEQVKAGVEEELQATAADESETDDAATSDDAADEAVVVEAAEDVQEEAAAVAEETEVVVKETEEEK